MTKRADRRKKVKAHIKRKGGHGDFEVTEAFALYWWRVLNDVIFDGALKQPVRIEIKNFRGCGGWCKPYKWNNKKDRRVTMGLLPEYWDRKTFLTVLAHEMVHQWEWEILADWNERVSHGKTFFSWKNKIKYRSGLPLDRLVEL